VSQRIPAKEFEKQYKDHLSGFKDWDQKDHAETWLLFSNNIGERLSIDEVAVTNGELYTIITNKAAHGKKGALVAIIAGTKSEAIIKILNQIPKELRMTVTEVTLDMSNAMDAIIRSAFPKATIVTDRFHVQQLVSEAVQETRIALRREALKAENEAIKQARSEHHRYHPVVFENGDTARQILARSNHLLFKPESKWSTSQKERAAIVFREYPQLKSAYHLAMMFRSCYEHSLIREAAKMRLDNWYATVEESGMEGFLVAVESVRLHETTILNYFPGRSTNAGAESFNAKLKGFRAIVRGVRDKKFFLFRVAMLFG
jgi:transposase